MSTTEEFWKAVAEFVPDPPKEHIYRIYYDPASGEITKQTHNEILDIGPCIEHGLDQYNVIKYLCASSIIKDGKIVPRPVKTPELPLKKSDAGFATVKNNMIFIADRTSKDIEYWKKS